MEVYFKFVNIFSYSVESITICVVTKITIVNKKEHII